MRVRTEKGGGGGCPRAGGGARATRGELEGYTPPCLSRAPPQPGGFFHALNSRTFDMIIVLKREATEENAKEILRRIEEKGLKPLYMPGSERVVLGALGDERVLAELGLDGHPMVESLKPILSPYKLVSREMHPHDTTLTFGSPNITAAAFTAITAPSPFTTKPQ